VCAALAGGAALAQNNPPPMNNPPPTLQAPRAPAPTVNAPAIVPPPAPNLSNSFPASRPASPALSDPVGRQLNVALGLAGGLRREMSEGRAGGERAGQLMEQLHKTLIGVRDNAAAQDRTPADEVWSRPQSEALALLEEVRQLRAEAMKTQPSGPQLRALQEATDKASRMFDKLSEASRKRHETAASSIRNIK
jgi:hypothetical protein